MSVAGFVQPSSLPRTKENYEIIDQPFGGIQRRDVSLSNTVTSATVPTEGEWLVPGAGADSGNFVNPSAATPVRGAYPVWIRGDRFDVGEIAKTTVIFGRHTAKTTGFEKDPAGVGPVTAVNDLLVVDILSANVLNGTFAGKPGLRVAAAGEVHLAVAIVEQLNPDGDNSRIQISVL